MLAVPDLVPYLNDIAITMGFADWFDVVENGEHDAVNDCVDMAVNNWAIDRGI